MQHPIDTMMQTTMDSIRGMVDVNTVVGTPVLGAQGTTIIPISKVSFGFIAGGGEYSTDEKRARLDMPTFPFAGGSGAGVSVQPVGFLVVGENGVKMLPAQSTGALERMVEVLPQLWEEMRMDEPKKKKKKTASGLTEYEELELCKGAPAVNYDEEDLPET